MEEELKTKWTGVKGVKDRVDSSGRGAKESGQEWERS